MSQTEINQREWENPANWSNRGFPALYFSKTDTRIWVPKQRPGLGWTFNLARPAGALMFIGIVWAPLLLVFALLILRS